MTMVLMEFSAPPDEITLEVVRRVWGREAEAGERERRDGLTSGRSSSNMYHEASDQRANLNSVLRCWVGFVMPLGCGWSCFGTATAFVSGWLAGVEAGEFVILVLF